MASSRDEQRKALAEWISILVQVVTLAGVAVALLRTTWRWVGVCALFVAAVSLTATVVAKRPSRSWLLIAVSVFLAGVGMVGLSLLFHAPEPRLGPRRSAADGRRGPAYPSFNALTEMPNIGDEANFFTGKILGADGGFYDPMTKLRVGDRLMLRIYVDNVGDPSLSMNGEGSTVATGTHARVVVPPEASTQLVARAQLESANARPAAVADTLKFATENGQPFRLAYVPGSAEIVSNYLDQPLGDDITTTGALIGTKRLDGVVPAGVGQAVLLVVLVDVLAA